MLGTGFGQGRPMKRFTGWLLLATLSPALALAQLKPPPSPTATRPVQLPQPSPQTPKADDRSQAADSAPPQGLFLAKVFWNDDEWRHYEPLIPPFTLI